MYRLEDTIAAIATPPGRGGIGILRLSGEKSFSIASQVLLSKESLRRERKLLFGKFQDPFSKEVLEEGLMLCMPGPHSYTGEDVVELHVHGSPSLLSSLLSLLLRLGARAADAGEFTYRAFQCGRLDLAQAEAVEALVSSQGEAFRRQALSQLTGGLSSYLEPLEEDLKALYLKVEARLEFSEDGIPPLDLPKFIEDVSGVQGALERLSQSYSQGKVLKEGLKVALVGPPNTGKSSLLNALLGTPRAIVTPLPGTTRDVVEGEFLLKGVLVRLFDTAGLRKTQDPIEEEGVRRSLQVIEEADLLFWLADSSSPGSSLEELRSAKLPPERTWVLFNKRDLSQSPMAPVPGGKALGISCLTGEGIPEVLEALEVHLAGAAASSEVLLTNLRHRQEVEEALRSLERLRSLIDGEQPCELWAEELRSAALAIGRIRGRNLPSSAFEEIFTKFCIGK